ncbi:MAG: glutamate racemase [Rhodoferax sp.]
MPHEPPWGLRPIGVFDSGVGGLSVLKALRAELPAEDFVYLADRACAPYGERDGAFLIERARTLTHYLLTHHHIQLLVMACNTATAAAIQVLRQEFPSLPIVGVEPALKPAAALSQTKHIGVMATRATLASAKFQALLASMTDLATFVCQPCDGLADAIERQETSKIIALCASYTGAMGRFGTQQGDIDTVVLGCTHYPFANSILAKLLCQGVHLVDNGDPVARQTRRLLDNPAHPTRAGRLVLLSTGDTSTLQNAANHWLAVHTPVDHAAV